MSKFRHDCQQMKNQRIPIIINYQIYSHIRLVANLAYNEGLTVIKDNEFIHITFDYDAYLQKYTRKEAKFISIEEAVELIIKHKQFWLFDENKFKELTNYYQKNRFELLERLL
jgi:hypothetical protein